MKIFALVLLCATAYLNNAQTQGPPKPEDYREKYDQLLMQLINERIREGERFVEKLSAELKEYQTSKKEDQRAHIESEVQFVLPLVKNVQHYFDTELKKPNLDMLEKFAVEKARDEAQLVIEALTEIEKAVAKTAAPVTTASVAFFADTPAPVDYRSEYDRLLFQTIEERIQRGDGMLLGLQRQLVEYQKSKNATVKDNIVREVDGILPLLKMAEDHATNELKRTDLDYLERFLYEKAKDQVALLIKHYTMIETAVKGTATTAAPTSASFEFFAATPAPAIDWRSEYDRLLFEFTENNVRRADELLVRLQRQVNEYKKTKDQAIADRVAREVDFTTPLIKAAQEHAQRELKRTDLDQIERYLFEKVNDEVTILIKYYAAMEKEVKSTTATTTATFEYFALADILVEVRAAEEKHLQITREVREYNLNKSTDAATKILAEIDAELEKVKAIAKELDAELVLSVGVFERFRVEREIRLVRGLETSYTRERIILTPIVYLF